MTEYIVLALTDSNWAEVGLVHARSSRSAIRSYIDTRETDSAALNSKFVAVPARSWKPVTIAVETKQTLRFT